MTRFTLLAKQLTEVEIGALKELVADAGCSADKIAVVNAVGDPDPDIEDEVILVLGTAAASADAELESNLAKAANGAGRAIWVWPQDSTVSALPAAAGKYCYSVIPWSSDKLSAVSADDDVTCFETPSGEPLPKVPTERNVCVEVKAKAK